MGSTRPRRVISPVMATLWRTGMEVSALTSAVTSVTPALGPSLGTAPSGTWMWMSFCLKKSAGTPQGSQCARTQESAAFALSCITSPNLPVSCRAPVPFITAHSTLSVSPPTLV